MLLNIRLITILYVISIIFGDLIDFSIDYFKERRVAFVCLLTCGNDAWSLNKFAKHASKQNIAVSSCNIDKKFPKNTKALDSCLKQTGSSTGVLINPMCSAFERVMLYASEHVLFDSKHKWLIAEERDIFQRETIFVNGTEGFYDMFYNEMEYRNDTEIPLITILNNLNLCINAEITLAVKKDDSSYILYDVYNFGKIREGRFVIENIGDWNLARGLNYSKIYKYYRRWDFQQMAFKMIVVMTPTPEVFDPQMILSRTPDNRAAVITVTSTMILHEITGIHNFRYNYTVVGIWVGDYVKEHKAVTNALYFQEQDITPVLRLLPNHFDRYDIAAPAVTFIETRFYYRIPSQGVGKFENQFLRPLSTGTWWCVIAICALCSIVLLLSAFVEHRPINVYYSIFSVLALICQQFFEEIEDIRRISEARKMTILMTGLFCLMIYNYYTSSVVSWLLNGPPPSINSLWELLDSPLQPIFEDVGYTYSWLQLPDYYYNKKKSSAEDELKRRLNNMLKKGKTIVASINDGIELVRQGGYAYHAEVNTANARIAQTFDQRELCDLDSLHSMEHVSLFPCLQKHSPFQEFFGWSLARLQERGIIHCIQERTWAHEVKCEGSSPRALALGGAAPAFIILAGGFLTGTVIVIFERFWWRITKIYETRNTVNNRNNP